MQTLLDFLRRFHYVFLFVLLEVVSVVLLFRFNNFQGSVWLSGANAFVAETERVYNEGERYFELGAVNRKLATDNLQLQLRIARLEEELRREQRDSSVTARNIARSLQGYRIIAAQVVSNRVRRGTNNYLVIDRGSTDGIRPEMGVVSGSGIVGITYLVGTRHTLVLPVTHARSSISCRVRGKHYFGYLQWDGKSTMKAFVDDIPRYAKAHRGSIIETSGYSAVFPPGIFVGRVDGVSNSSDGQSYRLDLTLGTDLSNVHDVQVIATPHKAEIDTLTQRAAEIDMHLNGNP